MEPLSVDSMLVWRVFRVAGVGSGAARVCCPEKAWDLCRRMFGLIQPKPRGLGAKPKASRA